MDTKERKRAPDVVLTPPGGASRGLRSVIGGFGAVLRRDRLDEADIIDAPVRGKTRFSPLLASFIGLVLAPAFAVSLYFAFIASDIYVSESSLAVRTIAAESLSGKIDQAMAAVSSPSSISSSAQDASIITGYIGSRAILDDLKGIVDVEEIYRRPGTDFWARLKHGATREEMHEYWRKMVNTYIDNVSGIINLQVRAFSAADARRLSEEIIKLSERLANKISDRARQDSLVQAEAEVDRANLQLRKALDDMQAYRNTEGMIDPVKVADQTGRLLMTLLGEKIQLESQIYVGQRSMGPDAPMLKGPQTRLQAVDEQIDKLRGQLAGTGTESRNIAASLARFEELMVRKQYSEKLYEFAKAGHERARAAAARQAIYVTVFVPPGVPDEAMLPKRTAYSFIAAVAFLILWSIGVLTWASVEDHRL